MMDQDLGTSRQQLLKSLRGRSLIVPDLQSLFDHWPQSVSPEEKRLRDDVDRRLESLFPEGERLYRMKKSYFALFGASWWPYASFEPLRIATYLSIWLFSWDDETDSIEFSSLLSDWGAAQAFRDDTVTYIRNCLTADNATLSASETTLHPIIASFEPIGEAIRQAYTKAQIERLLYELEFYIEMTGAEQRVQMSEKIPTVEEYQECRMGTSAVGVLFALIEYCYDMEMPPNIIENNKLKPLWDEANIIIWAVNDILSIGKEIAQEQVDSLIPLLYLRHGTVEAAVDEAIAMVKASIAAFDSSSQRLLNEYSSEADSCAKLQKFIDGCQSASLSQADTSSGLGLYAMVLR